METDVLLPQIGVASAPELLTDQHQTGGFDSGVASLDDWLNAGRWPIKSAADPAPASWE